MSTQIAPCGCGVRAEHITRHMTGALWPTVWIVCRCTIHEETWTERYEWDFNVPLGNLTHQAARTQTKAR
jgi:hypothetical protein